MPESAVRSPRGPYAKSSARRTAIISAATKVFASRGYHGGSLRAISRELGMSLTAVTHHFPDKTALLQAVLDAADHEIQPAWGFARAGHLSTAEAVLQVVRRNLSRPEMLRMLALVAAEGSSGDQPIHGWLVRRYDRLRAFIRESIARDQESGHVATQQDPGFLADAVIALWDGLQLQWLIDPRVDMAGRMRTALEALMPGAVDGSGAEGGEPLAPPSPSLAG